MTFKLSTNDEILAELSARLRAQRLLQGLPQQELTLMAGLSHGAVRNMEARGQVTLATLLRVIRALGLVGELETLFVPPRRTIAEMERAENVSSRQRARRRRAPAAVASSTPQPVSQPISSRKSPGPARATKTRMNTLDASLPRLAGTIKSTSSETPGPRSRKRHPKVGR